MLLRDYIETIRTLRQDKRFSFREVAEWLSEHGVPPDHNAVYREYRNWSGDPEGYEQEREREEIELDDEGRHDGTPH